MVAPVAALLTICATMRLLSEPIGPQGSGVLGESGGGFRGATACSYARYRRDVPAALMDGVVGAVDLNEMDLVLDLGCGTGQLAVPFSSRVRAVLALDPEPDMLAELHARVAAAGTENVVCVLAGDRDLPAVGACVGSLAVVGVANALHWMDADQVFLRSRELLRVGGGLVVISQGPPMWLQDSDWSRALRAFLEEWTGESAGGSCGTDRATLDQRVEELSGSGYEHVEVIKHSYNAGVDLDYVAGHLRSAMSESALPTDRRGEFDARLRDALQPHLNTGPLTEQIDATAVIAIWRTNHA